MLGSARSRVPVEVSFLSNKPLSFTAKVPFLDGDGNRFTIAVTGTTDNSILTSQVCVCVCVCVCVISVTGISDNSILTTQEYFDNSLKEWYEFSGKRGRPIMLLEKNKPKGVCVCECVR